MKIDLESIDKEQFMVHEHQYNGEVVYLVQPQHIGFKWTQKNKIFRSSVWNSQGELVSAGFPKFTNYGEGGEEFAVPSSMQGCVAVEKLDGSSLIVSKYKGQLIMRTRGTLNARIHDNGRELDEFISLYGKNFEEDYDWTFSIIFEWYSPAQRIVLDYGTKPKWVLVGAIDHRNYQLAEQSALDEIAREYGYERPKTYTFDNLENLVSDVEKWKGSEGVCLYSNGGQTIHKVKTLFYLNLHHLKSEISNLEKLVDIYLLWEMPNYEDFKDRLIQTFDFELFSQIQGNVSKICNAKEMSDNTVDHMKAFVSVLKGGDRKSAALSIIDAYGQTAKKGIAFNLLAGKELDKRAWKYLIMQDLGKG